MVRKITIVALLWLILVNPGSITNADTVRRMQMAHAWWSGTEEGIKGDKLVINVNGRNFIPYDLGQSMLMLPGDWLGAKLGQSLTNENERQQFREAVVSFLIFLPLNLLAVLACFRLLQHFGYPKKLAGLSSIILLLGTTMLFYTSFHQQNNQILLFTIVGYQTALAYVIKSKKQLAILSGVALGCAFLIRITSILYSFGVVIFLLGCITYKYKLKPVSQGLRSVFLWMIGFVPFVVLERILTYYRYGSWTATSTSLHLQIYDKADTLIESNAIVQGENNGFGFLDLLTKIQLDGLLAPLFSPEKSIFLYDPLVLPCLILAIICWKSLSPYVRWYLIAGIISFLLHLYIYSWTSEWLEHRDWGARYHLTSVHLLLIPLIPLLIRGAMIQLSKGTSLLKIALSWVAKIIVILAISFQFASISLSPDLETTQQKLNIGSQFRIVQRINNIFYILNREDKPNIQMSKVKEELSWISDKEKITWNILPFRYKTMLEKDSSLNKYLPLLFSIWGVIFILAVVSTTWIFIK